MNGIFVLENLLNVIASSLIAFLLCTSIKHPVNTYCALFLVILYLITRIDLLPLYAFLLMLMCILFSSIEIDGEVDADEIDPRLNAHEEF